ncbi:MAG: cytochrome c maturation protein CcmE [Maricaulaceae bacterium]|nr:cytochrome c maturation protein CcmE [Maricaulaceae bacterium]
MRKRNQRLWMIGGAGLVLIAAVALSLVALRDAVVFFYSPSEVAANPPAAGERVRVGGLVVDGSVVRVGEGGARFSVTDGAADIHIVYDGTLPDLFREGQGVVAEGAFGDDGVFGAYTVLARHDENYMPPEVAAALRATGHWREDDDDGQPYGNRR